MISKNMKRFIFASLMLLMIPLAGVYAQGQTPAGQHRVTGIVTDDSGAPLLGAIVVVAGSTGNGTITDDEGRYAIVCQATDELLVSYMGYESVTVPVNGRASLDITLVSQTTIDEVIVIGYGTTTRRTTVGAVDQVKGEAITAISVSNVMQALQGHSPGLIIQQRSFDPNDSKLNINIRGVGTMNNNSPLIVIDGLVSDDSSLNKLNPNDIESVSILKDASTAVIYGSRSANGVVLVSTKKGGKNQPLRVDFSGMLGVQKPEFLFRKVEGYQNATLKNLSLTNAGRATEFTAAQIRDLYENGNGEQFQNTIIQNALQQNYNVRVSGGGANTTYMISAGYYDQRSNLVGPDFGIERINFRTNLTAEYKRLTLTANVGYTHQNSKSNTGGDLPIYANATRIPSYYYYRMQDPETGKYLVNDILTDHTPLGLLEAGGWNRNNNDYININTSAEVRIIDGLSLKGVFGADIFRDHRYTRRPQVNFYKFNNIDGEPVTANNNADTEDWNRQAYLLNMQLYANYDKTFNDRHHVHAVFGASNESDSRYENQINIRYTDPELGVPGSGSEAALEDQRVTPMETVLAGITSIFGRLGYDYKGRYFIEASFRYDGSSKFEQDLRWGFFPSVSAGWRVSQENFMEWYGRNVGDLKVRASYGTLGNQRVNSYQYMTTYPIKANQYAFNNTAVAGADVRMASEDLRWEVSQAFNIGADATFFRNRMTVSFDWFNKITKNILVPPNVPRIRGATPQDWNAGKMRTQGWEVTIGMNAKTGAVKHNVNLNIGDSWNEVVSYEGFEKIVTHEEIWDIIREGLPLHSYYGYKSAGIFQSQEEIDNWAKRPGVNFQPGDLKIMDRNGDNIIDDNDWYYLGNAFPRYTFGVTYNVEWKGIDFQLFLQGALKRDMMVRGELVEPFHEGYGYTMYEHQLDYWTPTNTDARYPRLAYGNTLNYGKGYGSDLFIYNGAYLRVKNIMLGYSLPERVVKRVGMQKLRIYVNAQNLFTFSHISFLDPESSSYGNNMNAGGADSGRNYPVPKYYGMGLDFTF